MLGEKKVFCEELGRIEMQYVPRVLFTLGYGPWGNASNNQISIIGEGDVEGEMGAGPRGDFEVDPTGNIYIGDDKLKVFDKNGNYLFGIKEAGTFRVDKDGNIYVVKQIGLKEHCINKYDNQGKFLYTIDYDPYEHIYRKEKIVPQPPDEMVELSPFSGPPLLTDPKGREYKVHYTMDENLNVKKVEIEVYIKGKGKVQSRIAIGSFTLFSTTDTQKRTQEVTTPSIRAKIPDYKDLKYGLHVDFVDGEGNIYTSGLAKREKPLIIKEEYSYGCKRRLYIVSDLIVYKYDSHGNFITQVRFPGLPTVVPYDVGYEVDALGNIYCLQFHKDGMDVVKYEWKPVSKK